MSFELDTSILESALLYVEKATGRAMQESMKRAGKHTIIGSGSYPGAMQLTPKATKEAIDAVPERKIQAFVVARAKKEGKWPLTHDQVKAMTELERKRRARSVGYAAYAGWNNAAKAMGGTGIKPSAIQPEFTSSEASEGYGKIEVPFHDIIVTLANTAHAIEKIGEPALQSSLDNAGYDLIDYADRKLEKVFMEVNP